MGWEIAGIGVFVVWFLLDVVMFVRSLKDR